MDRHTSAIHEQADGIQALAYDAGAVQVLQLHARVPGLRFESGRMTLGRATAVVQREAAATLCKAGAAVTLGAGQMMLLADDVPFEVEFGQPGWQTWLILPASARGAQACIPAWANDGAPAALDAPVQVRMLAALADLAQALVSPPGGPAGQQHMSNAIAELVAAAAAAGSRAAARPQSTLAQFHLERIKQFILARLHDPQLSVRTVSQRLKISPAHIHRVFLGEGQTCSEWIWDQRLLACRAALEHAGATRQSVSQIAFGFGFSNSSHFSRAFRARFGVSPTACRKNAGPPGMLQD